MGCKIKTSGKGLLVFRLFFNGMTSWKGTTLEDTQENRKLVQAQALLIAKEIRAGTFDYLKWFPNGNKAHLFRKETDPAPSSLTVKAYYDRWIQKQPDRVRDHRSRSINPTSKTISCRQSGACTSHT